MNAYEQVHLILFPCNHDNKLYHNYPSNNDMEDVKANKSVVKQNSENGKYKKGSQLQLKTLSLLCLRRPQFAFNTEDRIFAKMFIV